MDDAATHDGQHRGHILDSFFGDFVLIEEIVRPVDLEFLITQQLAAGQVQIFPHPMRLTWGRHV